MADTTLTQTGAEVQADLDKVEGLANIKSVGSGLTLTSAGEIQVSGGGSGTQLYKHTMRFKVGGNITYSYFISNVNTPVTYVSPEEPAPITGFNFEGLIIPYSDPNWIGTPPYSIIKIDYGTSVFHYFDYANNLIKSFTISVFIDDTVTTL